MISAISLRKPAPAVLVAVVKNGDPITIDAVSRELSLDLPAEEIAARLAKWKQSGPRPARAVRGKRGARFHRAACLLGDRL